MAKLIDFLRFSEFYTDFLQYFHILTRLHSARQPGFGGFHPFDLAIGNFTPEFSEPPVTIFQICQPFIQRQKHLGWQVSQAHDLSSGLANPHFVFRLHRLFPTKTATPELEPPEMLSCAAMSIVYPEKVKHSTYEQMFTNMMKRKRKRCSFITVLSEIREISRLLVAIQAVYI